MWKKSKRYVQDMRDRIRRQMGLFLFDKKSINNVQLELGTCKRVLLIRWDAKYGDSIVSSFIFREMRRENPNISIEVVCAKSMFDLFKKHWHADQVFECGKRPSYRELFNLAKKIGHVDLVIHFTKAMKMKDLFFLNHLNPCGVASLDDEPARVDIKLYKKTAGLHFSEKLSYLLGMLGLNVVDTSYVIPSQIKNEESVSLFWPKNFEAVIAINPFGAGKSRKLTIDSLTTIINIVRKENPALGICLLCAPTEKDIALKVINEFNSPFVFLYPHGLDIFDVFAQLRQCSGLISVDTATIHVASGLKIPVLGLYNPDMENFNDWGPNNENAITVFSEGAEPNINNINWNEFELSVKEFMKIIKNINSP